MHSKEQKPSNINALTPFITHYIERADDILESTIHKNIEDKKFWPSSRKRQLEQLHVLEQTKNKLNQLQKITESQPTAETLFAELNSYFLYLANSIPTKPEAVETWVETIGVLKQLLRVFISTVVAAQFSSFHDYTSQWCSTCKEREIHVPYVQFNVIGFINNIEPLNAELVSMYLSRLVAIDWNEDFEIVFTKKAIRDRLFKIATSLVDDAGSMEALAVYLKNNLKNELAINNLKQLYQIYLKGVKRKYEILRITYPEFTYNNQDHPARADAIEVQTRMQFLEKFIDNIKVC